MVEDITVALGRWSWLFVIASSSAFAYKGRLVDVRQVGVELGVRYVLTGSVRKAGRPVRITVQLSDASDGVQIWAHRFEGRLDTIFDLQDQVATHAAAMIAPALRSVEMQRAQRKPTDNLSAYDLFLRALQHVHRGEAKNKEGLQTALQGYRARPHVQRRIRTRRVVLRVAEGVRMGRTHGPVSRGRHPTRSLGERCWPTELRRIVDGSKCARTPFRRTRRGPDDGRKSILLNPNSSGAWWAGGRVHAFLGNYHDAIEHFDRAHRFNPHGTQAHRHWGSVAYAHFIAGRYLDAERAADRAMSTRSPTCVRVKIATCGLLGRYDEGQKWVKRLLELEPAATVSRLQQYWEAPLRRNPRALEAFLKGSRLSGLPEGKPT